MADRPPMGRPFAGSRATAGGRGHRHSQTDQAKAERFALAYQVFELRVGGGLSIREIARRVDRSPSLIGRWLRGIPACGGASLDALAAEVQRLREDQERRENLPQHHRGET